MDVMWSFDKLTSFSIDGWFGAGAAAAVKEASRSSEDERGGWDRLTHSRKGSNSSLGSSSTSGSARVRRDHDRSPLSADPGYASGSGSDREMDDEDAILGPAFVEIPTDFPEDRPLKHVVRARTVQLYFTMNNRRAIEPSTQGQLCDVVVALEKYQRFGFSFADVRCPVTVLWGDKDTLIPQSAVEWMANNMRDVKIKVLEGEDHTLIWKEGVVEWAIRGIGEKYQKGRARQQAVPRVEVQTEMEAGEEEYGEQVEFGMAL
ncbi:hypothetical protein BC937DRAFT_88855 [Endogone sp. FLAS-F59071]|nr:hypothetical protein BC937DRAFT_88855 [Endogone sp. FLAS-F59071]|eukprot:RUS18349.1 hypothetical protein BC937DRAFT_88855 [Endogone sp. FLAS-F59071]